MKKHIADAIMTTRAEMLLRTWRELVHQLDVVPATKGDHTEVYSGQLQTKYLTISHVKVYVSSSVYDMRCLETPEFCECNLQNSVVGCSWEKKRP